MKILVSLLICISLTSCLPIPELLPTFPTDTSSGGNSDEKEPTENTEREIPGVESGMNKEANKLFELVNDYRESNGLNRLKPHTVTIEECDQHSYNMAKKITVFGHSGWNARYNTIKDSEENFYGGAENVAKHPTPESALSGWKGSYGHNKNMLKAKWTHSGMGAHKDQNGNWYYTQIFIDLGD